MNPSIIKRLFVMVLGCIVLLSFAADNAQIGISFNAYAAEISPGNTSEHEEAIKRVWNAMISELLEGNIDGAVQYFAFYSQEEYRNIFTGLGDSLVPIFGKMKNISVDVLYPHGAECSVIREEAGGDYSYPVRFVIDESGEWKIVGF